MSGDFDKYGFVKYMGDVFSLDRYGRQLLDNIVEYGLEHENGWDDQLVQYLFTLLPEVEFGEVANFCSDDILSDNGKKARSAWRVNNSVEESKSVFEEILSGRPVRECLAGNKEE